MPTGASYDVGSLMMVVGRPRGHNRSLTEEHRLLWRILVLTRRGCCVLSSPALLIIPRMVRTCITRTVTFSSTDTHFSTRRRRVRRVEPLTVRVGKYRTAPWHPRREFLSTRAGRRISQRERAPNLPGAQTPSVPMMGGRTEPVTLQII